MGARTNHLAAAAAWKIRRSSINITCRLSAYWRLWNSPGDKIHQGLYTSPSTIPQSPNLLPNISSGNSAIWKLANLPERVKHIVPRGQGNITRTLGADSNVEHVHRTGGPRPSYFRPLTSSEYLVLKLTISLSSRTYACSAAYIPAVLHKTISHDPSTPILSNTSSSEILPSRQPKTLTDTYTDQHQKLQLGNPAVSSTPIQIPCSPSTPTPSPRPHPTKAKTPAPQRAKPTRHTALARPSPPLNPDTSPARSPPRRKSHWPPPRRHQ